ncbi:hypothetical protein [Actinacidiphila soli]|nr:hypothetical protein [Actinacidiphila soli]
MNAGDAASWTDEQRHALATTVAALTGQPPTMPTAALATHDIRHRQS